MSGTIRLMLLTGIVFTTALVLLFALEFLTLEQLLSSAKFLVLALGVLVAGSLAVELLTKDRAPATKSEDAPPT